VRFAAGLVGICSKVWYVGVSHRRGPRHQVERGQKPSRGLKWNAVTSSRLCSGTTAKILFATWENVSRFEGSDRKIRPHFSESSQSHPWVGCLRRVEACLYDPVPKGSVDFTIRPGKGWVGYREVRLARRASRSLMVTGGGKRPRDSIGRRVRRRVR